MRGIAEDFTFASVPLVSVEPASARGERLCPSRRVVSLWTRLRARRFWHVPVTAATVGGGAAVPTTTLGDVDVRGCGAVVINPPRVLQDLLSRGVAGAASFALSARTSSVC